MRLNNCGDRIYITFNECQHSTSSRATANANGNTTIISGNCKIEANEVMFINR